MYQQIKVNIRFSLSLKDNSSTVESYEFWNFGNFFKFLIAFDEIFKTVSYEILLIGYKSIQKRDFYALLADPLCLKITYSNCFDVKKDFVLEKKSLKYYRNIIFLSK